MNPNKRKNVFELFGYDFLVDEDLRLWLIEVNTNPYLGTPNKFISELLPKMIDDMFEITLDAHFPASNSKKIIFNPYSKIAFEKKGRNLFELIYSDGQAPNKGQNVLGYTN